MAPEEQKEIIAEQIKERRAADGDIDCEFVAGIADKVGLEPLEVGRIVYEELGYKVKGCPYYGE